MTIAYAAMLIAVLLPYVWFTAARAGGGISNNTPRLDEARLEGRRARGIWAQNNAFEVMPGFLAAMLVAMHAGVPVDRINIAASVWVIARIAHGVFYLGDQASARSAAWGIGMIAMVYLFAAALTR